MRRKRITTILVYLVLCLVTLVMVFPFYWMLNISLQQFRRVLSFFPREITLANYVRILTETPFLVWFKNSFLTACMSAVTAIVVGVFGGYALARFVFKGKTLFAIGLVSSQAIPQVILLIPLYVVFSTLGLINTYLGITLSYLTISLPFSIWMLWGFFSEIPVSMEEAALIDGCTRIQALWKVAVPLAANGIAAVGIFAFVLAWQNYLYPLAFMSDSEMLTITVGATRFVGHERIVWGEATSLAFLSTAPIILLFAYVQKYMVRGLTLGAVKG